MRKLIISASVLALVACQDISTSPDVVFVNTNASAYSSPPPPPLDSGSYSESEYGSHQLNITYFLNKPGTNGWLTFQKNQAPGVSVDNNARISYQGGTFSGRGSASYAVGGGRVTLDLASVSQASSFYGSDRGYFNVVLSGGYFTSTAGEKRPLSSGARMSLNPGLACPEDRVCGGH